MYISKSHFEMRLLKKVQLKYVFHVASLFSEMNTRRESKEKKKRKEENSRVFIGNWNRTKLITVYDIHSPSDRFLFYSFVHFFSSFFHYSMESGVFRYLVWKTYILFDGHLKLWIDTIHAKKDWLNKLKLS